MELAYVCEWEKRPKSTHCPSIPLVCSWSCRNLVAFTTDLKNDDDDKGVFADLQLIHFLLNLIYMENGNMTEVCVFQM